MTTTPSSPSIRVDRLRLRDGLQLEYAERGRRGGPTLLLLHGITDSWRSFEPVLPYLPADQPAIALTQRGHGGSDKPDSGYRTRDFAADAAAVVRALGLQSVIVVGHSMGAANAMRLAIDHAPLVRGVVAAGAFASFGDKPTSRRGWRRTSRRSPTPCRVRWRGSSSSTPSPSRWRRA